MLVLPNEGLVGNIEQDSFTSKQSLLSPTDQSDNTIGSQEVREDSCQSPRSTSPSTPPVAINPKAVRRQPKKEKQRRNHKLKDIMYNALKYHRELLSDGGFMKDKKLSDPISNPSFSGIHSLLEGLSIVMFSRTHCMKAEFGHIHRYYACWLILGPNIFFVARRYATQ